MNKRIKTLIIALIVFGVLIGAYLLVTNLTKEEEDTQSETTSISVVSTDADSATKLSYKNGKAELSFSKATDSWKYDGDEAFPLSAEKLDELLSAATSVTATRDMTSEAQSDDSVYGFDNPTLTVNVAYDDGTGTELIFGSYNDSLSSYYLKSNGNIYLTGSDVVDAFGGELYDLLTTTDLETIDSDSITTLTITTTVYNSDSDNFDTLKSAYNSLSVGEVADYKNPEQYGFGTDSERNVTVEYTETTEVTAEDGSTSTSADITHTYSFKLATANGNTYIMLPDDDLIYNVSGADEFMK